MIKRLFFFFEERIAIIGSGNVSLLDAAGADPTVEVEGAACLVIGAGLVWWQWIIVGIGYLGIVYVMFSGARRLELRQTEIYGNDPEYQAYARKTPILIPFLPIYSVARYEWLRA